MKKKNIVYLLLPLAVIIIIIFSLIDYDSYDLSENDKRLLNYFNQVALKSENGDGPQRTVRWKKQMILYVSCDGIYPNQIENIEQTLNLINKTVGNEIFIITKDSLKSNSQLYLCKRENLQKLNSQFASQINGYPTGFFSLSWTDFEIENALIFINTSVPYKIQKSAILEELTQCLGLPNDSEEYSDSVFYQNKNADSIFTYNYSKLDIDLIKILYNPEMKVGLNSNEAEKIIKRILKKTN